MYDQKRFNIVRKMIMEGELSNKKVLDIGSGEHPITHLLRAGDIIRLDSNPDTNPDVVHDIKNGLPFRDNKFDMVVACEVIEHLVDTNYLLIEIKRVLKPAGYLVMSVPNICSLKYRLAFLLGNIPAHACKIHGEHVRDFNRPDIVNELECHGFCLLDTKTDGMWLGGRRIPLPVSFGDSIIIKAISAKFKGE